MNFVSGTADSFLKRRKLERRERDVERGYSVNVKQVVLAFVVEFWIIGLIITGTYLLISENGSLSGEALFSALLFPAALAMVELARVPLAVAVRTQRTWQIKLLASLGVIAAITVTSFSLSQIAWKSFDNRIAEATRAGDRVKEIKSQREAVQDSIVAAQREIDQKVSARISISDRLAALEAQVTKVANSPNRICQPAVGADGQPLIGPNGRPLERCSSKPEVNRVQLNALLTQIAGAKHELSEAEAAIRQANENARKYDLRQIDDEIRKADAEYRAVVNKSQLHSYTAMVLGKAVSEVTESEVKNLEKYLIIIPSIAAAFASTLIAITAVRRIDSSKSAAPVTIPDDAATYLFGPLLDAIRTEARQTVAAAINGREEPGKHKG